MNIRLVWFILFIWFIFFNQTNETNKTNQITVFLFVRIDNFGRVLWDRRAFRWAVVRSPCIEDHGDQTNHDRAADCRPEPGDRESTDQVRGEFQKERVDHNEKEPQREDDQGKGQHKENGPDQYVQKCEHQDRGESGAERVDFKPGHDHDRQKYRDARD